MYCKWVWLAESESVEANKITRLSGTRLCRVRDQDNDFELNSAHINLD